MISTYTELVTALGNWKHGRDLTSRASEFVALCEAKLNRRLRCREMLTTATGSVTATVALPAGFLEVLSLTVTASGSTWPVHYVSPHLLTSNDGLATKYSIVGSNIKFEPTGSGQTYTLTYYDGLSLESDGTNWLIAAHPDVYLYGTLLEAAIFLRDAEMVEQMTALAGTAVAKLESADWNAQGGALVMRAG